MERMRFLFAMLAAFACVLPATEAQAQFNYAEALQKSLYFYEAQQSGKLSPNNRVAWRGDACLDDGKDVGHDLSGGWFDAGDHWTANLTMAFAATVLAWAGVDEKEAFTREGQMDELLESLIHVNRYFLKCLANPDCADPATQLEVFISCGGKEGVPQPNVHAEWAPAEVVHLLTKRPAFKVNAKVPGADIPASMAAAMAASSIVIREHGSVLKGKRGYDGFDANAFADKLVAAAEKLWAFANANPGKDDQTALRSDGEIVSIGYRTRGVDAIFCAATWLHRAHLARGGGYDGRWLRTADAFYDGPYAAADGRAGWRGFGGGNMGKLGALNMARVLGSDPAGAKYHFELQNYCSGFLDYRTTPGGLAFREWEAHQWGSLRHANNAACIALAYSALVEQSPKLQGNTWFNKNRTPAQLAAQYGERARRQVDYALGDNPYGRSYFVGFGKEPFNHPHHRGAYGAWAGFGHFIKGKADDRKTCRHVLYGALIGGPDNHDVFLCPPHRKSVLETVDGQEKWITYYLFPNRSEPVRQTGYVFDPQDQPVQEVMDAKFNEVTLDYNAGLTFSLAWLTSRGLSAGHALPDTAFPPPVERNLSADLLATDREFFVAARDVSKGAAATEIEATIQNRSRWPARITDHLSFRYYFTLDSGANPEQVEAKIEGPKTARLSPAQRVPGSDTLAFVEVGFPGDAIYPGTETSHLRTVRLRLAGPHWDKTNDWSHAGLASEMKLLPRLPVFSGGILVEGDAPPEGRPR